MRKLRRKRIVRRLVRRTIFLSLACLVLLTVAIALLYIPYFRIQKISIEGNSTLETEKILAEISKYLGARYFKIFPRDNILILSGTAIIGSLAENFHRIKEVSIERNFPSGLFIKIREYQPEALLCKDKECAFVSGSGFVFERAPYFSGDIFLNIVDERDENNRIEIRRNIIDEEQFKKLIEFKNLASKGNIKIFKIILKKDNLYNLHADRGWFIIMNEKNDPRLAFENLKITLDSEIKDNRDKLEYVDIRIANKVFYKFK